MLNACSLKSLPVALILMLLSPALSVAADPAMPEGVTFEKGIEYANPDNQHLQLNMARPAKGDGPFSVVVNIHGGGYRAGSREGYIGNDGVY